MSGFMVSFVEGVIWLIKRQKNPLMTGRSKLDVSHSQLGKLQTPLEMVRNMIVLANCNT